MRYPDFLRHIVNSKLAEYSNDKDLTSIIDEIRKMVAKAEEKYNFSSFGGNPENLANYLKSEDFKLVVSLFRSVNKLEILEKILIDVKRSYAELPNVVSAVRSLIEELNKEKKKIILENIAKALKKELPNAEVNIDSDKITLKLEDNIRVIIKPTNSGISLMGKKGTSDLHYVAKSINGILKYIKSEII